MYNLPLNVFQLHPSRTSSSSTTTTFSMPEYPPPPSAHHVLPGTEGPIERDVYDDRPRVQPIQTQFGAGYYRVSFHEVSYSTPSEPRPPPVDNEKYIVTYPRPPPPPLEPKVLRAVDQLLSPPSGYYNPSDQTYTLDLEWAVRIIGKAEFVQTILPFPYGTPRRTLRPYSRFRGERAGLPRAIRDWLSGLPAMEVMRFPAALFRSVPSPGKS